MYKEFNRSSKNSSTYDAKKQSHWKRKQFGHKTTSSSGLSVPRIVNLLLVLVNSQDNHPITMRHSKQKFKINSQICRIYEWKCNTLIHNLQ